jgi:predicted double-glycine peptidase
MFRILIILVTIFSATQSAVAENIVLPSGGGAYTLKTTTLRDYRFRDVIEQKRDFSCGSAALATLLAYHYERPVSETQVLHEMYAAGDKKKIEKEGFSLLDMKQYLAQQGIHADGYKETLDKLAKVGIPAIALINNKGYLHFVLIRGVRGKQISLADPAQGAKTMDRAEFEKIWNGILFVVLDNMPVGRAHFNLARHWGRPLGNQALTQFTSGNLAGFALHITRQPGYF